MQTVEPGDGDGVGVRLVVAARIDGLRGIEGGDGRAPGNALARQRRDQRLRGDAIGSDLGIANGREVVHVGDVQRHGDADAGAAANAGGERIGAGGLLRFGQISATIGPAGFGMVERVVERHLVAIDVREVARLVGEADAFGAAEGDLVAGGEAVARVQRDGVGAGIHVLAGRRVEGERIDHHRACIGAGGRIGVVLGAQRQRTVGDARAVAGDDGAAVRNARLRSGERDRHADRAGDLHRAAFAFGRRLAVGARRRPCLGARGGSPLVGEVALVMDLVRDAAALVLAVLGLFAARGARLGERVVRAGRARAEGHRAGGGQVARGRRERGIARDGEGDRDADARVRGLRVAFGARVDGARVRRRGLERALDRHRLRVAGRVVGERAKRGVRIVVRDRNRNHRRHRGLAGRAAGGDGRHVVLRRGVEQHFVRAADGHFIADGGRRIGGPDVERDRGADADLAGLALVRSGACLVQREALGDELDIAVVGDRDGGVRRERGVRMAQADVDGERTGHAGVRAARARGGLGREVVRRVVAARQHQRLHDHAVGADGRLADRRIRGDIGHVDRHGDADAGARAASDGMVAVGELDVIEVDVG